MLRRFMDEKDAAGVIPVSRGRWELTGRSDEVPAWAGRANRDGVAQIHLICYLRRR